MRNCLILCLALSGCIRHYIPVAEHAGVQSSGTAGFIAWPTSPSLIAAELESMHIDASDCAQHCGVYVNIVFDENVSFSDVANFRDLISAQVEELPGPTYVRVMYGQSGVHLYAQIMVGTVELL